MIRIEEIWGTPTSNWDTYERLRDMKYFVPFVGAGLSAGIGSGSWNDLLRVLAERVIYLGLPESSDENRRKRELDLRSRLLIAFYLKRLKRYDRLDEKDGKKTTVHIQKRIKTIEAFVRKSEQKEKKCSLQYSFFEALLTKQTRFASYEAAEMLWVVDNRLHQYLYDAVMKKRAGQDWKIGEEHAAYWLVEILKVLAGHPDRNRESYDCYTTNYDDILESACAEGEAGDIRIRHLHGYFDSNGNPQDICLTLTDLLDQYGDGLNAEPCPPHIPNVYKDEKPPLLFLGTSFSEGHIGRVTQQLRPGSYAVVSLSDSWKEDRDGTVAALKAKMEAFQIPGEQIVFYPTEGGNHEALPVLLHQLARDLGDNLWNDWSFMEGLHLLKREPTESEKETINDALSYLKNHKNATLLIKKGKFLKTEIADNKITLRCPDSDILYFICQELKESFPQRDWSEYYEAEKAAKEGKPIDREPLGNTLYIYWKRGPTRDWNAFTADIREQYSCGGRETWEYRIVKFDFGYRELFLTRLSEIKAMKVLVRDSKAGAVSGYTRPAIREQSLEWNDIIEAWKRMDALITDESAWEEYYQSLETKIEEVYRKIWEDLSQFLEELLPPPPADLKNENSFRNHAVSTDKDLKYEESYARDFTLTKK